MSTLLSRALGVTRTKSTALTGTITRARRLASHALATPQPKQEGDISSVFVSLSSGATPAQLPERFAIIKRDLVRGREAQIEASWRRLLAALAEENDIVARYGPRIWPEIEFENLTRADEEFKQEVRKRGVAVVRGVVPESEARGYKEEVEKYVRANPDTKGAYGAGRERNVGVDIVTDGQMAIAFPSHDPQVFELYWSLPQVRARLHENIINTQLFLTKLWHTKQDSALISNSHAFAYADRVRIRQPGDAGFALGPHIDGGSVERWEPNGYGRGGVYDKIWQGDWEKYDPWEASCRVSAVSDLYNGAGACSMFRMFQGWLSMSHTGPKEGTLMVNPLLQLSTAYCLLRPFFTPIRQHSQLSDGEYRSEFLNADNWKFTGDAEMTSELHGATPGHAQELNQALHPHLDLSRTMVHVPRIKPGDFVVWHCDTIHAVDKIHMGKADSSVMYIPVCPVTEANAEYVARQRETFQQGFPGPDFPGGKGEAEHIGRPTETDLRQYVGTNGLRAMGLEPMGAADSDETPGGREVRQMANSILGFA